MTRPHVHLGAGRVSAEICRYSLAKEACAREMHTPAIVLQVASVRFCPERWSSVRRTWPSWACWQKNCTLFRSSAWSRLRSARTPRSGPKAPTTRACPENDVRVSGISDQPLYTPASTPTDEQYLAAHDGSDVFRDGPLARIALRSLSTPVHRYPIKPGQVRHEAGREMGFVRAELGPGLGVRAELCGAQCRLVCDASVGREREDRPAGLVVAGAPADHPG